MSCISGIQSLITNGNDKLHFSYTKTKELYPNSALLKSHSVDAFRVKNIFD